MTVDVVRAWVDFHELGDTDWCADRTDTLRGEGLEVTAPDAAPTGSGVLFFGAVTAELCGLLRRLSGAGQRRVLAVAGSGAALGGAGPWPLLDAGASDVIVWDRSPAPADDVMQRLRRWEAVDRLVGSPLVRDHLVGTSTAWQLLLRDVVDVAVFSDAPVLVTGESGTGKELVARLVHALDPRRRDEQLVLVDCTTIVPALSGSEFFGHEKGAFTGALASRDGAFALANRGTLFLDEVGELPMDLQAELLRVVQEGTYKRVGSNTWRSTGFRLVCATNRDLRTEEAARRFRGDLYHRIAAWTCRLPSLRERTEDILPLARHFLHELRPDGGPDDFDPAVQELLLARDYPGNIRELRQLVGRMARRHAGSGPITAGDVPLEERPAGPLADNDAPSESDGWPDAGFERSIRRALASGVCLKDIGAYARETAVVIAVREAGGNLQQAARALGVTDRALQLRRRATDSAAAPDTPVPPSPPDG